MANIYPHLYAKNKFSRKSLLNPAEGDFGGFTDYAAANISSAAVPLSSAAAAFSLR